MITVRIERHLEVVQISVHNEGNPISPEAQTKLFELFQQADSAQSPKRRGWGIGLSVVRAIAEAHGGKTYVESSAAGGTTFTIELPLSTPAAEKQ